MKLAVTIRSVVAAAWAAAMLAPPAVAVPAQVAEISVESYIVFFRLENSQTGVPSCNTAGSFALDTRNDAGRSAYALLLSAKAAGWALEVVGTGSCTVHSGYADVHHITVD